MKKYTWKVWLQPNKLTKEVLNDSIATVSTAGQTKRNEDVARAIKEEGSDLQLETLLDVIQRVDRWKCRFLLDGFSVQDGNMHVTPRVRGNWEGADPLFDPATHKITVDAVPTAGLRKSLDEDIHVEVLGKKSDGGAIIGLAVDATTGRKDGFITPDGDLIITGEKIRVEPLGEEGLGISFVDANGTETPVLHPLTQNDPKKVVCRVPVIGPGEYALKIVTRHSNGTTLLKTPRVLIYEIPLTVE
jgi:hypothetical protein